MAETKKEPLKRYGKNQFFFGDKQEEIYKETKEKLGTLLQEQESTLLESGGYFIMSNKTFDQLYADLNKLMESKELAKSIGLNNRNFHQIVSFYMVLSRNIIKRIGDFHYCTNIGYTKLVEKYNFNRKHILTYIEILTFLGYLKVVKFYKETNNYYPQLVVEAEIIEK